MAASPQPAEPAEPAADPAEGRRAPGPPRPRPAAGRDGVSSLDLGRPLLAQMAALGARYDEVVHASIGPRDADRANRPLREAGAYAALRWPGSLRIFRSDALERLSHVRWWVIPLFWGPVIVSLFAIAVQGTWLTVAAATGWAAAGLLAWTLCEYVLHRFLFHWRPRGGLGRRVHFLAHGIHHLDPWDPTRLVFPPLAGVAVAALLYVPFWILLPWPAATALMAGLLGGYIVYDMAHYRAHHARPRTRWGRFLKAWHLTHHHKAWDRMYGVSTPLWDLVFRTGAPPRGATRR